MPIQGSFMLDVSESLLFLAKQLKHMNKRETEL